MSTTRTATALAAITLMLLGAGCGRLTIRTWATIIEEDSGGGLSINGAPEIPISRLQGGMLTSVVVYTNDLDGVLNGEIVLEDVRMAGLIDGVIGPMCNWNDPSGASEGTLAVDLFSQESVTDVFLDAKATTGLSVNFGLPPVDVEQPVDFDLGGALDPTLFADALATGSADGMFESQVVIAADTLVAGFPATFRVDVTITNGALPPLFDADLLEFCGPYFAEQERDLFYGINAKSSYLIRNGADAPVEPLVIDLAEVGAAPGDTLHLATVGSYDWITTLADGSITKLGGVFSATPNVLPATGNLHRVSGAIDAGPNLATWPTQICGWLGCFPLYGGNDIPQDFRIDPARDIVVPAGANYLVVAPIDDWKWWKDNGGLGFGLTVGVTPAG